MQYNNNQMTMNNTMKNNGNNQPNFPSNNPVSKVESVYKTKNDTFADTLEWCHQASEFENCSWLLGSGARNAATTCIFLHALQMQVDGKEIQLSTCLLAGIAVLRH